MILGPNIEHVLGWMAVTAMNHFPHPDDEPADDPLGGCCIVNCGPCSALHKLDDAGRRELERLMMLTGYHMGGWEYWDETTSQLDWVRIEAVWAQHKSCGISDGVLTGCTFDESENP